VETHVPMVSRILHLLVIDILAVGVAMRRNADGLEPLASPSLLALDETNAGAAKDGSAIRARRTAPGVSLATPLAALTSHSR
jgi:glucokinase